MLFYYCKNGKNAATNLNYIVSRETILLMLTNLRSYLQIAFDFFDFYIFIFRDANNFVQDLKPLEYTCQTKNKSKIFFFHN